MIIDKKYLQKLKKSELYDLIFKLQRQAECFRKVAHNKGFVRQTWKEINGEAVPVYNAEFGEYYHICDGSDFLTPEEAVEAWWRRS